MSGYSNEPCFYDEYHTKAECCGAKCQFKKMCDNHCGSVLHSKAIICILTTPKGEEQVWCEDCKLWNWGELEADGWQCDDEEGSDEEDDGCVCKHCGECTRTDNVGAQECTCNKFCKCDEESGNGDSP